MTTPLHTFKFSEQLPGSLHLADAVPAPWWQWVWAGLHSPIVLRILAAGAVIGLVLTFHAVVTQAVRQSALRQQELAIYTQTVSRCKQLPSTSARRGCLLDISAPRLSSR